MDWKKYKFSRRGLLVVLKSTIWIGVCLVGIYSTASVQAAPIFAPEEQIPINTPTPGPDGRIIWIVKANDTLLGISLISGVPIEEIRALNNFTSDTIFEGQEIMLGLGGPAGVTITPGPSATITPFLPTPSPKPGTGNLCILLFNDHNGDSIRQEDEPSIQGGAISVSNRRGTFSDTRDTEAGLEPHCYEEIPEGDYSISVAVPEGYNATTRGSIEMDLKGGDETYINFGAQANAETLAESQLIVPEEGDRSPLLGIVGALFLLAGVVVALFAGRILKGS